MFKDRLLKAQKEIRKERIETLKKMLTDSDYKVIKCTEYALAGKEPPYDIEALHAERQNLRDKINELEEKVND